MNKPVLRHSLVPRCGDIRLKDLIANEASEHPSTSDIAGVWVRHKLTDLSIA